MMDNNANDNLSHLDTLDSIEQDIHTLLDRQEGLIYTDLVNMFDGIKKQLLDWMENVHLVIFAMEQKAKDGAIMSSTEVAPLQTRMAKMEGVMGYFADISDSMDEKFDKSDDDTTTARMAIKVAMAKIQSEWSGLYHFMLSVTKQVETAYEKHELLVMMQNIMLDIDNLTSTIFQYQEKRHLALATAAATTTATTPTITENGPNGDLLSTNSDSLKDEALLSDLDQRVNPVFLAVEKVYARMNSARPPGDDSGILVRKHRLVQEKWECLRIEIDELKDELKEDRWLAVFRQVADQVDTMINGLDKAVQDCYNVIQQIFDWHDPAQHQHQQHPHSPSTLDKLSKTFLRSFPRNQQSSASIHSSSASSVSATPPPFDREKFKSIEKNFEAKYTYYTPSIDRMLTMLGNGIASRMTKDNSTCERQAAMLSRWQQLKTAMDHLRMHDLMDAERCLVETPISPASSVQSDKSHHRMWKSIRRRTSDQESSNSSDSNNYKARASSITSGLPRMNQSTSQHEDYRRVRSVTPSSGTYQHHDNYHRSTKFYTRQQQRTTSPLNFSSHPSPTHYNKVLRPSTSETSSIDSGSASMRPTPTGRKSLTPVRPAWNTSIKPDKPEFSSLEPLWKGESRATSSGPTVDSSSTFARHQQRRKSHVPRPPSAQQHHHPKEASFMKPTKSTMLRKRSQSVEPPDIVVRPKTPTRTKGQSSSTIGSNSMRRTKTPTTTTAKQLQYHLPPRPKSSLARQEAHDMLPYVDRERNLHGGAKSPIPRRSGTPSLIPRPKTPTGQHHQKEFLRSTSPSMVPRPQSSMRLYQQDGQAIPPVPPLPSNLERPSIHLLKVGILNKDDVYDDNEAHVDDGASSALPDSFLSVPSIFDSNDTPLLYHQSQLDTHQQHHHQNTPSSISSSANSTKNSSNFSITNSNHPTTQQRKRELLKKRSMPALAIQRSGSPFQSPPPAAMPTVRTTTGQQHPPPSSRHPVPTLSRRRRLGYFSEDEDDDDVDDEGMLSPHSSNGTLQDHPIYTGDPRDPLDMEVATILNASPIAMQCQKCPQGGGKYYFGNELNPTVGGGKKLYTCKLINYSGRPPRRQHGAAVPASAMAVNGGSISSMATKNKVLIRVGGGWTELSQFLLDHALFL